ncbi:SDR family oxidoreductase [Paenibacillus andongensis]|uniref:SDR family oxidoreductase n=1 Tax=Paenibacillus andongensis TaxID=2975482 RepID=UPI0021BB893F|nr:NmrA family NAD(P)-binding protein [Paenibacillus andongensis]
MYNHYDLYGPVHKGLCYSLSGICYQAGSVVIMNDQNLKSFIKEWRQIVVILERFILAFLYQADAIFLANALSPTETAQGLAAVEAAKRADVKKIVYLSVPMPEDSKHMPHFKSKIPVEEAIRQSGASFTILRPNNFFQNDYWYREAILHHRISAVDRFFQVESRRRKGYS